MDTSDPKQVLYDFLKSHYVMNVAVAENNKPSASILLYYIDKDLNMYFATHGDSYKTIKLRNNPAISLCVWEHRKTLVQADGVATEIVDAAMKLAVVDNLAEAAARDDSFWPPLFRIKGDSYAVFKIKLSWARMLDLTVETMTQEETPFIEVKLD